MLSFNIKDFNIIPLAEKVSPIFSQTKYSYRIHGLSSKKHQDTDILFRWDGTLYNSHCRLSERCFRFNELCPNQKLKIKLNQFNGFHSKIYIGLSEKLRKDLNLAAKSLITVIAVSEGINE